MAPHVPDAGDEMQVDLAPPSSEVIRQRGSLREIQSAQAKLEQAYTLIMTRILHGGRRVGLPAAWGGADGAGSASEPIIPPLVDLDEKIRDALQRAKALAPVESGTDGDGDCCKEGCEETASCSRVRELLVIVDSHRKTTADALRELEKERILNQQKDFAMEALQRRVLESSELANKAKDASTLLQARVAKLKEMMEDAKQSNTQRHRTLEGYKEANEKMQTVLSMQSDSLQAARSALAHRQAEVASLKTSLDEAETRAAQTEEKRFSAEAMLGIRDTRIAEEMRDRAELLQTLNTMTLLCDLSPETAYPSPPVNSSEMRDACTSPIQPRTPSLSSSPSQSFMPLPGLIAEAGKSENASDQVESTWDESTGHVSEGAGMEEDRANEVSMEEDRANEVSMEGDRANEVSECCAGDADDTAMVIPDVEGGEVMPNSSTQILKRMEDPSPEPPTAVGAAASVEEPDCSVQRAASPEICSAAASQEVCAAASAGTTETDSEQEQAEAVQSCSIELSESQEAEELLADEIAAAAITTGNSQNMCQDKEHLFANEIATAVSDIQDVCNESQDAEDVLANEIAAAVSGREDAKRGGLQNACLHSEQTQEVGLGQSLLTQPDSSMDESVKVQSLLTQPGSSIEENGPLLTAEQSTDAALPAHPDETTCTTQAESSSPAFYNHAATSFGSSILAAVSGKKEESKSSEVDEAMELD